MTYNTKAEFMAALKSQAEKYSLSFGEMAEDFERHFSEGEENGETESEICAKLGDPVEIVKEYVGENSENVQSSNSNVQNITAGVNRVDSNTGKISGGIMAAFTPNVIKGFAGAIKAVARLHVRAFAGRKAGF